MCSSNVLEEKFQTQNSSTWNISRYGVLDLALRGIIPIEDNRLSLDDNQGEGEEINDISEAISEMPQGKDISKTTSKEISK